jgi:hypothetical protein
MFNMVEAQGFLSSPANIVLHYIVPLMTLADWLLFDKKGGFKKSSPFVWLAIPAAYLLFSLIRAHFATYYNGGRYPYFFINIDTYGIERVAWNVLVLGAFLLVIGYCFYALDWGLARLAKKAKSKRNRR